MRIGIDCRLSGLAHAGIGRYIENLVIRLPRLAPDEDWVYFVHDQEQLEASPSLANIAKLPQVKVVFAPVQHYSVAEQLKMPRIFAAQKLDVLHVPHFNVPVFITGKLVVTIHDLLWHEHKGLHVTTLSPLTYFAKYAAYRFITRSAVAKAQAVIVPTNSVRSTLTSYYPQTTSKTTVTPEGIGATFTNHLYKPYSETSYDDHQLLYVGSLYPHKNIELLLLFLQQYSEYSLVLVGSRNVFADRVKRRISELSITNQVSFTGFVTDAELIELARRSLALVQPSLSEGFGLTGLEGMAAGTAVLASDIPVFHEVYQDGAVYFDPQQVESLATAIASLTSSRRQQLIVQGRQVAKQYSWDEMANQTLAVYKRVLSQ